MQTKRRSKRKRESMKKPKILIWDIETSMQEATIRGFLNTKYPFKLKASEIKHPQKIHCIGYKWLGEKKSHVISVHDFPSSFKKDHLDDSRVVKEFVKILKQADASIGHNLKSYDMGHLNARLMLEGLPAILFPHPIDTYILSRSNFQLPSQKLDEIARFAGLPVRKNPMKREDWEKCYEGDLKSFKKMAKYCKQDIELTEAVYNWIYPYVKNHPKISRIMGATLKESHTTCPVCNSKESIKNGRIGSTTGLRQRRICTNCGKQWVAELIK